MPVGAGPAAYPVAAVEDLARAQALLPGRLDPLSVVAVNRVKPALAQVLLGRLASDPAPLGRVLGDLAVGLGEPHHLGASLYQRPVPLFTAAKGLGSLLLRCHIDGQ